MTGTSKKEWKGLPTLLQQARERNCLSRAQAAVALGLGRQTTWEIDNDKRPPKAIELAAMADLYGIDIEWLFGRAKSKPRDDRLELAAQMRAHLDEGALDRPYAAIRIVKQRTPPSDKIWRSY
jgi:transcriptional regulator with XRE-family HTH domain